MRGVSHNELYLSTFFERQISRHLQYKPFKSTPLTEIRPYNRCVLKEQIKVISTEITALNAVIKNLHMSAEALKAFSKKKAVNALHTELGADSDSARSASFG